MKLVFPGGEHPQVLLGPGVNVVGSDPAGAVVLDRPGVMPRHCELHVSEGGVVLQVPGGATVEVNGRSVSGVIALRPGDVVGLEHVQARLASMDAVPPRPLPATPALPREASNGPDIAAADASAPRAEVGATTVRPALPRYVLRGVSSAGFGRTLPLVGPVVVGRSPECGIQLDYPGLSRQHARLTPTAEGLLVEDLGSTNGCLVNDARVDRAWAQHGDEVGFDVLRFRVVAPAQGGPVEVRPRSAARTAAVAAPARQPGLGWWWLAVAVVLGVCAAALWVGATLPG